MKKYILFIIAIFSSIFLTACGYQGNYKYFSIDTTKYGIETGYAIVFPKGSNLVTPVNEILTQMDNNGVISCLVNYWTGDKTDTCRSQLDFKNKVFQSTHNGNGKTLTSITSSGYEPFEMRDGKGNLTGFDIDLANFIAKELNYVITWNDVEFDKIVGDITNKKADIALAAITPTDERQKSVDFSVPYYNESFTVAIFKENDNLISINDLKNKVVSAQSGTVQAQLAEKLKKEGLIKDVSLLNYPATAMQSLKTNKVDVFLVEKSIADEILKTYNKK